MRTVELLLLIAVAVSVVWVVRLIVGRVAEHDREVEATAHAEHEVDTRLESALQRPGLLPDDPMVVDASSAIEPKAEAIPCPICDGRLHVDAHEVDEQGPERLRKLTMRCGDCGRNTTLYARIESPIIN